MSNFAMKNCCRIRHFIVLYRKLFQMIIFNSKVSQRIPKNKLMRNGGIKLKPENKY